MGMHGIKAVSNTASGLGIMSSQRGPIEELRWKLWQVQQPTDQPDHIVIRLKAVRSGAAAKVGLAFRPQQRTKDVTLLRFYKGGAHIPKFAATAPYSVVRTVDMLVITMRRRDLEPYKQRRVGSANRADSVANVIGKELLVAGQVPPTWNEALKSAAAEAKRVAGFDEKLLERHKLVVAVGDETPALAKQVRQLNETIAAMRNSGRDVTVEVAHGVITVAVLYS